MHLNVCLNMLVCLNRNQSANCSFVSHGSALLSAELAECFFDFLA